MPSVLDLAQLAERLQTTRVELRAQYRFFRNLPDLLPTGAASPGRWMQRWAEKTPDNLAIAYKDERYTWREANERANQYASWFVSQGIGAGDVAALVMDNRPEYLFATVGLSKLGAVGALINTNLRDKPLAHAIGVAKPRKVLAGGEHADAVRDVIGEVAGVRPEHDFFVQMEEGTSEGSEAGPIANKSLDVASRKEWADKRKPIADETYCYIYTSGTTGLPKAAIITNRRMVTAATLFGEAMIEGGPGDVIYIALPLYHSSAMYIGWGSALRTGAAVALRKKFSASNFWKDVGDYGATSFLYIGELCRYLLNTPPQPGESAHKLRVAVGNGLRPDIWEPFQRRFNIPTIREFYGATEGNAPVLNFEGRPGMIGRRRMGQVIVKADLATGEPIRNAKGFCEEIKVGETGLLLGKITKVLKFDGYVDGAATKKKILENVFQKGDQYFNSGDLIVLHDNGWLAFGDRVGDTFRWKGENVSTNEVAEVLNKADGVLESNVYGVQVPHTEGRAGMAALTVGPEFDLDAFAKFACEKLPNFQRPHFLRVLKGDMRITGTFKHQKVDYRNEGFDPRRIQDPLYFLQDGKYHPIDLDLYKKIEVGDLAPQ